MGQYTFLVVIVGKTGHMSVYVIDSNIPLLMLKGAMRAGKMKTDLDNDTEEVFEKNIDLQTTNSSHYCLPLIGKSMSDDFEWLLSVQLEKFPEDWQFLNLKSSQAVWTHLEEVCHVHEGCQGQLSSS